jgi:hypothetical protein
MRLDYLSRLLLGLVFGVAGAAIWQYQGGTGPLYCMVGGFALATSGVLAFTVHVRFFGIVSAGLAACGYTLLWIATLLLWDALSFDRAGHYLAYPVMFLARAIPLFLSLVLLCASLLGIVTSVHFFFGEQPKLKGP